MKKFVLFCCILVFGTNIVAQIDLGNWELVFYDDFTSDYWDTWENWRVKNPEQSGHYYAYLTEAGVTHGNSEHQVYQRENCKFHDGNLVLKSEFKGLTPMQAGDYSVPPGIEYDTAHKSLYYTSGNLQTSTKFLYGYFEIRCKLPIHAGSFPAFWLWDGGANFYNEIDIFEYSNMVKQSNTYKKFTTGIYCDNTHPFENLKKISYARIDTILPEDADDLTHFHVFGCKWMPDKVEWYVDGTLVNEYSKYDSIPHHPMTLKVNYAIDNYALMNLIHNDKRDSIRLHNINPNNSILIPPVKWEGSDSMVVDYIKVYKFKGDCDLDALITSQSDLDNFDFSVKKSVTINSAVNEPVISSGEKVTFRVTDFLEITGPFTIEEGAEFSVIAQDCYE